MHRTRKQSLVRWIARFLVGRPIDGYPRTDSTIFSRGTQILSENGRANRWDHLAGWQRVAWRLGIPATMIAGIVMRFTHPVAFFRSLVTAGIVLSVRYGRRMPEWVRTRRFRNIYLIPLATALRPVLGIHPYVRREKWLTVSPDLAGLAPALVKPMSPAELWIRGHYGLYVEPVVRWLPDRISRLRWALAARTGTLQQWRNWFRRPAEQHGPRVELRIPMTFVTDEMKKQVRAIIAGKLGLHDLDEKWYQVGAGAVARFTVRARPPERVALADIIEAIEAAEEHELVAGLGTDGRPVIIDLDDDSPHIACSAGSGAGKSVLAMILALQILRRGGRVLILDRKGSHRWARGLDGVTYCGRPADMHAALIGAASLADARNTQAFEEDEGWDPGPRVFIIFEEMNATVAQLKAYWDSVKTKDDPKFSPAIQAFRDLMYMGRSAKHHLFGVAQMLTANTTGGPEARENFGVRCLARYTANNWKMLAPECPMPRKSKVRGRWQIVVAGEAIETQVAFATAAEVRKYVSRVSPRPETTVYQESKEGTGTFVDPLVDLLSLREAADQGVIHVNYEAAKKRFQRDPEHAPSPAGRRGAAALYRRGDLIEWSETVLGGKN